ncbi:pyrroline-5-carboxylate reductase [Ureibacillus thermosphaericus]|uniref:pyrroline-5-carboxylate reductase n=1 Tax=Ureibacillus thermosphaericus TaxID=51173 RepID=UPI0030C974AA
MQKIVFMGAGSMAEALIHGWIKNEVVPANQIYVKNRSNVERLHELKNIYGVHIIEQLEEIKDADLVILAMKPKDAKVAFESIAPYLSENTAILSVLAGIAIEIIEKALGVRPIARVMPNTSAAIGMAASGIAFNKYVNENQKRMYLRLLEAVGIVIEVEEDKLHAVTALSGSGPAYLYYLMEAWENIGTEFGLSKETVRKLMVQTVAGAAMMLQTGQDEPCVLRKKVTSPGGTTEAGIKALERHRFNEAIYACIKSAEARSRELAKGQ